MDRRFGELQFDRHDRRDRTRREPRLAERRTREIRDFFRGTAALASDAERQDRRVKYQGVSFGFPHAVGHDDPPIAVFNPANFSGM